MMDHLLRLFPRLRAESVRVTSPRDRDYNCVAWAAGVTDAWWWPVGEGWQPFWPEGVPRQATLDAFQPAFATLGYASCDSEALEGGFEKVALFADATSRPTHVARQLPSGRWASKLGKGEDIEHDLHDIEGDIYGAVVLVMSRPLREVTSATS
jgi:hypothetical protein